MGTTVLHNAALQVTSATLFHQSGYRKYSSDVLCSIKYSITRLYPSQMSFLKGVWHTVRQSMYPSKIYIQKASNISILPLAVTVDYRYA